MTGLGVVLALALQAPAPQDHATRYSAGDIETGARLYAAQCALCHGPNGDLVNGVDLRRGQFRRAQSDEDLGRVIRSGVPEAGMPAFALGTPEVDGLVAFIRVGFGLNAAVKVGDATRGQMLFEGKGGCGACHRVNQKGSRVAPDLSDIGVNRSPASLQRSLGDPTSAMIPINRPVRAVTRDGRTIRGRRLNEDTHSVQLIDEQERLVSLTKSELREYEVGTTSPMPSFAKTMSAEEIADLVAYLMSLRGSP
jgi:putative heme-binding domain-containing protein